MSNHHNKPVYTLVPMALVGFSLPIMSLFKYTYTRTLGVFHMHLCRCAHTFVHVCASLHKCMCIHIYVCL